MRFVETVFNIRLEIHKEVLKEENVKTLRRLRRMVGLGQFELAVASRVERSKLSLFENGHAVPTVAEKAAIKKALEAAMQKNSSQFSRLLLNT